MKIFTIYFALGFCLIATSALKAQTGFEKPKNVIIADGKIVTMEMLEAYAKSGRLKGMHKGVTQKSRDSLFSIYGDAIGDKEFITIIELNTDEELKERKRIATKKGTLENKDVFFLTKNDKAKDFTVKMIDGTKISLSDLKGKVVLLNFWATWCAPCLQEFTVMPEKILKPFENDNFIFIPVAIGQTEETVAEKMKQMEKYGVFFNVGYDTHSKIWDDYATGSIPKNFLIDKEGIIQYTSTGYVEGSLDELAKKITQLLKE